MNFNWRDLIIWLILNIIIMITMDIALFQQTTSDMKNAPFLKKLVFSEFWATLEWFAVIPAQIIGNRILTAPQLNLSSFVFDFIGQIATNSLWLNIPTTVDDYAAMVIILLAMVISTYRIFG